MYFFFEPKGETLSGFAFFIAAIGNLFGLAREGVVSPYAHITDMMVLLLRQKNKEAISETL